MKNQDKKDIQGFIAKCNQWASNLNGVKEDRLIEFDNYLNSDKFLNQVTSFQTKSKDQKEFNSSVSLLVYDKIIELIRAIEHDLSLDDILNKYNIQKLR